MSKNAILLSRWSKPQAKLRLTMRVNRQRKNIFDRIYMMLHDADRLTDDNRFAPHTTPSMSQVLACPHSASPGVSRVPRPFLSPLERGGRCRSDRGVFLFPISICNGQLGICNSQFFLSFPGRLASSATMSSPARHCAFCIPQRRSARTWNSRLEMCKLNECHRHQWPKIMGATATSRFFSTCRNGDR